MHFCLNSSNTNFQVEDLISDFNQLRKVISKNLFIVIAKLKGKRQHFRFYAFVLRGRYDQPCSIPNRVLNSLVNVGNSLQNSSTLISKFSVKSLIDPKEITS